MEAGIGPGHEVPYLDLQVPGIHICEPAERYWLKYPYIYPGKSFQNGAFFGQGPGSAIQYDGDNIYFVVNGHPESAFLEGSQVPPRIAGPFREDQ